MVPSLVNVCVQQVSSFNCQLCTCSTGVASLPLVICSRLCVTASLDYVTLLTRSNGNHQGFILHASSFANLSIRGDVRCQLLDVLNGTLAL